MGEAFSEGDRVIVHPRGKRLRASFDGAHGEVVGVTEKGALEVRLDDEENERGFLVFATSSVELERSSRKSV